MADQPLNISTTSGGSALVPQTMLPNPVTLPTIPNPTPPPPQKLAVITPAAAKADLTTKQTATNQVAAAAAAQSQNKLLNTFGQPVNAAGGSPVPNGQQQQQAPAGTQAAQQPVVTKPNENGAQTVTNPNLSPVSLPNGVKANYDASTGTLTTEDGKALAWNQTQGAWVDPTTQLPPQAAGAAGTTGPQLPATGDPTSDYILSQMQQNQASMDAASATHQKQLNQILNGTFPLTADQQAQVAGLKSQLDQLRETQEQANADYLQGVKLLGARSGRSQFQPGVQNEDVNKAITDGTQKIANLDIQAASAVATLKQGFLDNDYKVINQSYDDLQNNIKAKNETLTQMQSVVKGAVDIQTAKLNQQKTSLDIQSTLINNVAQSALSAALKLDGTLDFDVIQQIADDQGIDPNALYGAVQKAHQDEIVFQQGESKFATDQLQATATLANTKANTANTYANIAKTQAETAALKPIDMNSLPTEAKPLVSAFNSAVTGLPAAQVTQAKSTFNSLINQGDVQGAKDFVIRVAASSLPAAEQTQVIGRSEALSALTDIQSLLDQAKAKSTDTGLIKGSLVNLGTKLGQNSDPDLQYIGSRIQEQLQVYRRAMTGVAFSPQESAQYEKIFPDITNVDGLNTTKIQALTDGLSQNNRADLEFAIGKSNYDQLFAPTPSQLPSDKAAASAPQVSAGSTINYQGKNYKVDAQGNLTAI